MGPTQPLVGSVPRPQAADCQWVTVSGSGQPSVGSVPRPQAADCQWVTVSGSAQPLVGARVLLQAASCSRVTLSGSVQQTWQSRGPQAESEVRSGSWFQLSRPQVRGLCPAELQNPCQDCPLVRRPWGGSELLPDPHLCEVMAVALCLGHSLWGLAPAVGWPEESEGQLGPGHLAPSVVTAGYGLGAAAEICLFSQDLDLKGAGEVVPRDLPFLVRTENNICLVEIYKSIITWQQSDHKNKGFDTKKFATTNHTSPLPFLEKSFAESLQGVWVFSGMSHSSPCMLLLLLLLLLLLSRSVTSDSATP